MGKKWNPAGFHFLVFIICILVLIQIQGSWSLNSDGLALLQFRAEVESDPHGTLATWNPRDIDPCLWSGVHCVDGKVRMLDLSGLSLEGMLVPELGQLIDLRFLILNNNNLFGDIPKELGELTKLELLDLRNNNLSGYIPAEFGRMVSLKRLLLCGNNLEGNIPMELAKLSVLSELYFDENLESSITTGPGCTNRKFENCIWQSNSKQVNKAESLTWPMRGALKRYVNALPSMLRFKFQNGLLPGHTDNHDISLPSISEEDTIVRRQLFEKSSNLAAAPASITVPIIVEAFARSSGGFSAVLSAKKNQTNALPPSTPPKELPPSTSDELEPSTSTNIWKYGIFIPIVLAVLLMAALLIFLCRTRKVQTIKPWKTGLSGQLQKAFVTGVPKLNRSELQTACEDFSNIIDDTLDGCTIYKGTLSSGVEISVLRTVVTSSRDWPKSLETAYRRKIDTISRINHKNFVNLIGYCEEDQPFSRMMVFEYAPNGTLHEHLHVEEMEHLDWITRMRIIMGVAYCLEYMHELKPPIAHSGLKSSCIYLTDDYAAKVAETYFTPESDNKHRSDDSVLPPLAAPETNVYSFGILLLEIITGKLPYSKQQGPLEKWAREYLAAKKNVNNMVDPSLKAYKHEELAMIREVIVECIQSDPRQRPTMKHVVAKLRALTNIAPEQAIPRLSPLWWAELEILSMEAT